MRSSRSWRARWRGGGWLVVTHGGTIWCFRYVLERWTYEGAERRFNTESNPNCSVTAYRFDAAAGRLALEATAAVHWK